MNRIRWVLILWLVLAVSTVFQLIAVEYSVLYNYKLKDYIITPGSSLVTGILLLFVCVIPVFDFSVQLKTFRRIFLLSFAGIFYSIIFILIMHLFPIVFVENPSDYKDSIFSFAVASFHNVIKNYLFRLRFYTPMNILIKRNSFLKNRKTWKSNSIIRNCKS